MPGCGDRFRYPERAFIIISFCCNVVSLGYITRLLAGREAVACTVVDTPDGPRSVLVHADVNHTDCIIVFLLVYFFSTSSCVWWILLKLQWVLVVGMLWTRGAIERHAGVLHVVAWTLPTILTVANLVNRSVYADELTGLCYVGGGRSRLLFAIVPFAAFLIAGTIFLVAGFASLYRSRRNARLSGTETDHHEVFVVRIDVFCMLYVVPAAVSLACCCYEHVATNALSPDDGIQPSSAVLTLKVFCSLIVGTTSSMWILNGKTLHSWKTLFKRVCKRRCSGRSSSGSNKLATGSVMSPRHRPSR